MQKRRHIPIKNQTIMKDLQTEKTQIMQNREFFNAHSASLTVDF
jgi:hypothetical protein